MVFPAKEVQVERDINIIKLLQILREDLRDDGERLGEAYLSALAAWVQARIRHTVHTLRGESTMGDLTERSVLDELVAEICERCPRAACFVHDPCDRSNAATRSLVDAFCALAD